MKIGIDFGTSFSNVSALSDAGVVVDLFLKPRGENPGIPTILFDLQNGSFLAGEDAKAKAHQQEDSGVNIGDRYIADLKRMIRRESDIDLNEDYKGTGKTPWQLIEIYLVELLRLAIQKAELQQILNRKSIETVTVGCPATCPSDYRETMQNVVSNAVFTLTNKRPNKVNIVSEPTLAAISYLHINKMKSGNILVFDMGGGTTDVAIVKIKDNTQNSFDCEEECPVEGEMSCGGRDLDIALYEHLLIANHGYTEQNAKKTVDEIRKKNQSGYTLDRFQDMKHQFYNSGISSEQTYNFKRPGYEKIPVPSGLNDIEETSLEEFEKYVMPKIKQAMEPVRRMVEEYKKSHDLNSITKVVMVGGCSHIPLVKTMLEQTLRSLKVKADVELFNGHLSTAISDGAAIYNGDSTRVTLRLDKTYGIKCRLGSRSDLSDDEKHGVSNVLIANGQTLPATHTETGYKPIGDEQEEIGIIIFESDSTKESFSKSELEKGLNDKTIRQLYKTEYSFDVVRAPNIDKASGRSYSITISLDENRRLTLTAQDEDLHEEVMRISGNPQNSGTFGSNVSKKRKATEYSYKDAPRFNLPENLRNLGVADNAPVANVDGIEYSHVDVYQHTGLKKGDTLTGKYNIYLAPSNGNYYAVRLNNGQTDSSVPAIQVQRRKGAYKKLWARV